jgi:hypothetical protein
MLHVACIPCCLSYLLAPSYLPVCCTLVITVCSPSASLKRIYLSSNMTETTTSRPGEVSFWWKHLHILNMAMPFEIVVAHYNENLEWLTHVSAEVTVYSKGDPPAKDFERTSRLPNIGREGHTFLYHIVSRYDTLADTTLFLQGDIHAWNDGTPPHTELSLAELRERSLTLTGHSATGFGVPGRFSLWDGMQWDKDPKRWLERRGKGMRMSDLTPGQFWRYIFGKEHPESIAWTGSGIFAVTSKSLRQRPLTFWHSLLNHFEEVNHANPEEGHFLERFWMSIFSADDWSAPGSSNDSLRGTDSDTS